MPPSRRRRQPTPEPHRPLLRLVRLAAALRNPNLRSGSRYYGGVHPVTAARSRSPSQANAIGIGKALQDARVLRRKSVEEASRETRIRRETLSALEREDFDLLGGDVYARGALRTYSAYVGLNPDRVLHHYSRRFGPLRGLLPQPAGQAPTADATLSERPTVFRAAPTWAALIGVALLVLAVLAALGLLSW